MSIAQVAFCAVALLVCQAAGQITTGAVYIADNGQPDLARPAVWDAQLPAVLDPLGCTRPGGLPLALDPLRRCSTYISGARLPLAIDPLGCSRPGPVPLSEDPFRLCTTHINGSPWPAGIDRLGLAGRVSTNANLYNGIYTGNVVAGQPGSLTPVPQMPASGSLTGALPSMGSVGSSLSGLSGGSSVPSVSSVPSASSVAAVPSL